MHVRFMPHSLAQHGELRDGAMISIWNAISGRGRAAPAALELRPLGRMPIPVRRIGPVAPAWMA